MSIETCVYAAVGVEESQTIYIGENLPFRSGKDNRPIFEKDANAILDALVRSLPGGTFDALLRAMLMQRASQLVVPTIRDRL